MSAIRRAAEELANALAPKDFSKQDELLDILFSGEIISLDLMDDISKQFNYCVMIHQDVELCSRSAWDRLKDRQLCRALGGHWYNYTGTCFKTEDELLKADEFIWDRKDE